MKIDIIKPIEDKCINAIVETPGRSQGKFAYNPEADVFRLKKLLPFGMVFPFDFGFIPNTTGGDGDPLDIMIISEEPTYPGCLVQCKAIGLLEAMQKEKDKEKTRNDRIVAISLYSHLYADISHISDLNTNLVHEIEQFFINYNKLEGKIFTPVKWHGPRSVKKFIEAATK